MKLYVGNLSYRLTDAELEETFAPFGNVLSAKIIMERETNRSKGFGFVEFESKEEGKKAIESLNEKDVGGRALVVNEARPPKPRTGGGGGGHRNRY